MACLVFLAYLAGLFGFGLTVAFKSRAGYEEDRRANERLKTEIRAGLQLLAESRRHR